MWVKNLKIQRFMEFKIGHEFSTLSEWVQNSWIPVLVVEEEEVSTRDRFDEWLCWRAATGMSCYSEAKDPLQGLCRLLICPTMQWCGSYMPNYAVVWLLYAQLCSDVALICTTVLCISIICSTLAPIYPTNSRNWKPRNAVTRRSWITNCADASIATALVIWKLKYAI